MILPSMPYKGERAQIQTVFKGLNHNIAAGNGEIWDMQNMSSDFYPVLGTRGRRSKVRELTNCHGIFAAGKLFYVDGTNLYVDGVSKGTVADSDKVFCSMGERLIIWPDKLVYTLEGNLEPIEKQWSGANLVFRDGEYAGEKAQSNTIYKSGVQWSDYFKVGDGVTISGCSVEANNLTLVIREIDGNFMRFYENSFQIPFRDTYIITDYNTVDVKKTFYFTDRNGDIWNFYMDKAVRIGAYFVWNGSELIYHDSSSNTDYILEVSSGAVASGTELEFDKSSKNMFSESGTVTIQRMAPDLDFLCGHGNRVWGCKGDTIYASKLGDPYNWNVFDGLSTDSYSVGTGTENSFTGCISYLNYPVFFKENRIFKVYGTTATAFQVVGGDAMGVLSGSSKSLAVAGNTLFYLSRVGVVAYNGGVPSGISFPLGDEHFKNAVGGSDGIKYFVSMQDEKQKWHLFVYDTQKGLWHREDDAQVKQMAYWGGLYAAFASGKMMLLGDPIQIPSGASSEADFDSMAEFGDFDMGTLDRKHIIRLRLRIEAEAGSKVKVFVQYDSSGSWREIGFIRANKKGPYTVACPLKRCDHYRLRLKGKGLWKLYALEHQYYVGGK